MVSAFSIESILSKKSECTKHLDARRELLYSPHDSQIPMYYGRHFCSRRRSISPPLITSHHTSAHASEDEDDKVTRRPRTSITMCQRDFLEGEFQKERYPTLAYIDKLSRQIHLPQYVIKVWFQNRRAKYRKEGHRRKQRLRNEHKVDIDTQHKLSSSSSWKNENSSPSPYYSWLSRDTKTEEYTKETLTDSQAKAYLHTDRHSCLCYKCRGTSFVQY